MSDWHALVAEFNTRLRLRTTITGMKHFERVEDMEAIPRIRRPKAVHTTDQMVSMASRLGWTVSPLESGRLDPPDICLLYATPGPMILFINGLQ